MPRSFLSRKSRKCPKASLGQLLWLAFSGGETFLRDDLVEIADVFYKNNRPAIILLPTNGLLPRPHTGEDGSDPETLQEKARWLLNLSGRSRSGPRPAPGRPGAFREDDGDVPETQRAPSAFIRISNWGSIRSFARRTRTRWKEHQDSSGASIKIKTHTVSPDTGRRFRPITEGDRPRELSPRRQVAGSELPASRASSR